MFMFIRGNIRYCNKAAAIPEENIRQKFSSYRNINFRLQKIFLWLLLSSVSRLMSFHCLLVIVADLSPTS